MAKDAKITKAAAGRALESFVDGVAKGLKKQNSRVTLVGFGTFRKVLLAKIAKMSFTNRPKIWISFDSCKIYPGAATRLSLTFLKRLDSRGVHDEQRMHRIQTNWIEVPVG